MGEDGRTLIYKHEITGPAHIAVTFAARRAAPRPSLVVTATALILARARMLE